MMPESIYMIVCLFVCVRACVHACVCVSIVVELGTRESNCAPDTQIMKAAMTEYHFGPDETDDAQIGAIVRVETKT